MEGSLGGAAVPSVWKAGPGAVKAVTTLQRLVCWLWSWNIGRTVSYLGQMHGSLEAILREREPGSQVWEGSRRTREGSASQARGEAQTEEMGLHEAQSAWPLSTEGRGRPLCPAEAHASAAVRGGVTGRVGGKTWQTLLNHPLRQVRARVAGYPCDKVLRSTCSYKRLLEAPAVQ